MGDRYLKTIFGFMGITDFTTIAADKLDVIGEDVNAIVENTIKVAIRKGKFFLVSISKFKFYFSRLC